MGLFILFIAMAALIAAVILLPSKVRFRFAADERLAMRDITVLILGIIPIRIKQAKKKGKTKPNRVGKKTVVNLLKKRKHFMRLEKLIIMGCIGIEGDAAATALLCGTVNDILSKLVPWLLETRNGYCLNIMPEFRFGTLWIYMEGIITIKTAKLIGIIGKEVIRYVTPRRKHNAQHNGTAKADG